MKIKEAIAMVDELKANTYTSDNKIQWLSRLDSMAVEHVLRHYIDSKGVVFNGYNAETDMDTELIMPEPFAEAYIRYLSAQIDLHNADYDEYNNTIELFNASFQEYKNWYNRNHSSVISQKYFRHGSREVAE